MSISKNIRLASTNDSVPLLKIYSEFIINTFITFEVDVPSALEFNKRIENVLDTYPWLICEINGEIIGYAYASKHRERAAYDWSVDVTVYINPQYHRKNIATALYTALIKLLKIQGFCNAYAGVASPNIKSERFHETFGFKLIGTFHNAGYKLGEWRDVKWFELNISECPKTPETIKTINEIRDTEEFKKIIDAAVKMIK